MELICINNWVHKSGCCTVDATDELFMGVRVIDGKSIVYEFRYPFQVWIAGAKLIFRKDNNDTIIHLSKFSSQSEAEIKDLLYNCVTGNYHNKLIPLNVEYIVTSGNQSTFLIPIPVGNVQILDTNYYLVFVNSTPTRVGIEEFEWTLDVNGNIFFTVPIEDVTPGEDPFIVTIYYWVKL